MSDAPKISIVMPVYNVEKYLRECLDSVRAQTFTAWECICVDDGSTDSSAEILHEYCGRDLRFRVFVQQNAGSGKARNLAIENACGDYICFMDPDDFYPDNNVLSVLYGAAVGSGLDVVGGRAEYMTHSSTRKSVKIVGVGGFSRYGIIEYKDEQQHWDYWRYIYKRSFINERNLRFPLFRRRQDPPFFVEVMIAAGRFLAIEDYVYCYRGRDRFSQVDWISDGGVKLRDNLSGLQVVNRLAIQNGLWRLLVSNTRCITQFDAFRTFQQVELTFDLLNSFFSTVHSTGQLGNKDLAQIIQSGFLSKEKMGFRKLSTLIHFFGLLPVIRYCVIKGLNSKLLRPVRKVYRRVFRCGEFARRHSW